MFIHTGTGKSNLKLLRHIFSSNFLTFSSDMTEYPFTKGTDWNTWTKPEEETVTLDYIFATSNSKSSSSSYALNVDFEEVRVEDLKTTINNVSISDHNSVFANVKLGCSLVQIE